MLKKIMAISLTLILTPAIFGCMVTRGTYLQSVNDAYTLKKKLDTLQDNYNALRKENDTHVQRIKGLESENKELEGILKAKSDELSDKIVELRQKASNLEREKAGIENEKAAVEKEIEKKNQRINELEQKILDLQLEKQESLKDVNETYNSVIDKMKAEIAEGKVTITELKGKLTVNMLDSILFDLGKAEIRPEGLEVLNKVVDVIKDLEERVVSVEGHTDNLPIRGSLSRIYPTNWELSAARAVNVTRYLQEQGIEPNILSATAFGEYNPAQDNDTEEGRAKNRRIEIILIPKDLR